MSLFVSFFFTSNRGREGGGGGITSPCLPAFFLLLTGAGEGAGGGITSPCLSVFFKLLTGLFWHPRNYTVLLHQFIGVVGSMHASTAKLEEDAQLHGVKHC